MIKQELQEMLQSLNVPINEGVPSDENTEAPVRICYWDYSWHSLTASGSEYNTEVTYQISILAEKPRCEALIKLKKKLNAIELFPDIQHEYDIETRRWHSYFALEVLENV